MSAEWLLFHRGEPLPELAGSPRRSHQLVPGSPRGESNLDLTFDREQSQPDVLTSIAEVRACQVIPLTSHLAPDLLAPVRERVPEAWVFLT